MISEDYRRIIATIVRNALRKEFPGLKKIDAVCRIVAKNVHARMYGANVDGVDSPIWQDTDRMNDVRNKPNVDAKELLK